MLPILFERYKSPRQDHAVYYENEFFDKRLKPVNLLQVGMDSTLQSWLKYLEKANIYCIDTFINHQPKDFSFLKEKRIFWCRCDVSNRKNVDDIMKRIWNKPRFDIIIDNTNNHENLKRHCIGKYYLENKNEVIRYSS
tara:strand:- start:2845 stop:3258 length:414 start_codon:yes stop_codon:yes gene_type:complete